MKIYNRKILLCALSGLIAVGLVACGASDERRHYSGLVSFGDSLSDVGTYKVGVISQLGGKYTINSGTDKIWVESLAEQMGLPTPCAAQTGLEGDAALGLSAPVVNHPLCFNYSQGGARVTDPVGPGNRLLGGDSAKLGQLTVPVKVQIANHLSKNGGKFSGDELVTVMAGANDVLVNLQVVAAALRSAGLPNGLMVASPMGLKSDVMAATTTGLTVEIAGAPISTMSGLPVADISGTPIADISGTPIADITGDPIAAASVAPQKAVLAMSAAATELADYVKQMVVAKGAQNVLVLSIPDIKGTPFGQAQNAATQGLIDLMVTTFNAQLKAGLKDVPEVLWVDTYAIGQKQMANPSEYGLTNVTMPACNLSAPGNSLASALICNATNVLSVDVSRYFYADMLHPTPYVYQLLAQDILKMLMGAYRF